MVKVRVFQRISSIDPFPPVKLQKLAQQRQSQGLKLTELAVESGGRLFEFQDGLCPRQISPSRHVFLIWGPQQLKNQLGLVQVGVSGQDGLVFEHFPKDAADPPHVNSGGVLA